MHTVTCEFHNIQSHQATHFQLMPGLNFILADDNNVGKSTIFKVLSTMAIMPKADNSRLNELLRKGADRGCAVFTLENTTVTFWLFREAPGKVRAFFEEGPDETDRVRSVTCPKQLLSALDIVLDKDGKVINFNDADSVQLIVTDSPKNDEVLAHVLIDPDVERIKENAYNLNRQIISDYQVIDARYRDATASLQKLHYNPHVDEFEAEKKQMGAVITSFDSLEFGCSELLKSKEMCVDEIVLKANMDILGVVQAITTTKLEDEPLMEQMEMSASTAILDGLNALATIDLSAFQTRLPSKKSVAEMSLLLDGLNTLERVRLQLHFVEEDTIQMNRAADGIAQVNKQMQDVAQVVSCPVKGKVYYSNEECIPVNDGPPSGFSQG